MLTKLLDFLFHRHKWVILDKTPLYSAENNFRMPVGDRYHLQCTVCGAIKKKDLTS